MKVMPAQRPFLLAFLAISGGWATVAQADALETLNERGLSLSGKYFVVASEDAFIQKVFNMVPIMDKMAGAFGLWADMLTIEYQYQALTDYRLQLQGQITDADQFISQMPRKTLLEKQDLAAATSYRAQMDQELRNTNTQIAARQKRLANDRQKEKAEKDFEDGRKVFLTSAADARPLYESVMQQYKELAADETVKNALTAYTDKYKVNVKLGPSDKLKKAARRVIDYERNYSPETAPKPEQKKRPTFKGLKNSGALKGLGSVESQKRAAVTRKADPRKARDQLRLAADTLKELTFGGNEERNALKRHAIDGMNIIAGELKTGTVPADRLDDVLKDVASLQKQKPMAEANADIIKQASEYLSAAVEALK